MGKLWVSERRIRISYTGGIICVKRISWIEGISRKVGISYTGGDQSKHRFTIQTSQISNFHSLHKKYRKTKNSNLSLPKSQSLSKKETLYNAHAKSSENTSKANKSTRIYPRPQEEVCTQKVISQIARIFQPPKDHKVINSFEDNC